MAILNEEKITKNDVVIENIFHDSSNILKTSYNYATNQLVTTFKNGGVYTYDGVPELIYEEFKNAPSSGTFLNGVIKQNYKVAKKGEITATQKSDLLLKITEFKSGSL